ncbi:hypothetical protein K432DRAFT_388916 [Lepidopterella palustris CBS 459.81]|uniref:Uncharacterized protein n=1 Tax=Lepidopterella palustris CBS 459.81 TaxID=1314670 RepID=A0A8E2EJK0_9PEZI|nr:hypothetical protein K432DRAFT_388916 [Lepidopterella palustris CBS 459.81]
MSPPPPRGLIHSVEPTRSRHSDGGADGGLIYETGSIRISSPGSIGIGEARHWNLHFALNENPPQDRIAQPESIPHSSDLSKTSKPRSLLPIHCHGIAQGRKDKLCSASVFQEDSQILSENSDIGASTTDFGYDAAQPLEAIERGLVSLGVNHEIRDLVLRQHSTFGLDPRDRFFLDSCGVSELLTQFDERPI